jgi:hypothetical protein
MQNKKERRQWACGRFNQTIGTSGNIKGLGERGRNQILACCPYVTKESFLFIGACNLFSSGLSGRLLEFDFSAILN